MVVCAGSSLIDCIVTEYGDKDVADDISFSPGGEAFNGAVWLASLGEDVALSSAIGDDYAGKLLKEILNTKGVLIESGFSGKTPVSILTVNKSGERKSRISKAHTVQGFNPIIPSSSNISFITMGSLFRAPFITPEQCYMFASKAKMIQGTKLLADTKLPKGEIPELQNYAGTLGLLDYITPNEQEALFYTGKNSIESAAEVFRSYGIKNVIIKCGPEGCYVLPENGNSFKLPAYKVKCIDGIGAGDSFNAGMIYSLIRTASIYDAVLFATACAALCVTGRGAISSATSAQNVQDFINKNAQKP